MDKRKKTSISGKVISVVPEGYNTVNPWLITREGSKLIAFIEKVFEGKEDSYSKWFDDDGLIIHAEVKIGNSVIGIFEAKPDWPFTPCFLQIYVDKMEEVVQRAINNGAQIITEPSDFVYGEKLARIKDPFGNIWWLNERMDEVNWEDESQRLAEAGKNNQDETPLKYIRQTLIDAMKAIR